MVNNESDLGASKTKYQHEKTKIALHALGGKTQAYISPGKEKLKPGSKRKPVSELRKRRRDWAAGQRRERALRLDGYADDRQSRTKEASIGRQTTSSRFHHRQPILSSSSSQFRRPISVLSFP